MAGVCGEIACPQCGGKAYSDMETYDYALTECEECFYLDAVYFYSGGHTLKKLTQQFDLWIKAGAIAITVEDSGFHVIGYTSHDMVEKGRPVLNVDVCLKCCNQAFLPRVSGHYIKCKILGRITVEKCAILPDDCAYHLEHVVSKGQNNAE
jgi:hypothetical protein